MMKCGHYLNIASYYSQNNSYNKRKWSLGSIFSYFPSLFFGYLQKSYIFVPYNTVLEHNNGKKRNFRNRHIREHSGSMAALDSRTERVAEQELHDSEIQEERNNLLRRRNTYAHDVSS